MPLLLQKQVTPQGPLSLPLLQPWPASPSATSSARSAQAFWSRKQPRPGMGGVWVPHARPDLHYEAGAWGNQVREKGLAAVLRHSSPLPRVCVCVCVPNSFSAGTQDCWRSFPRVLLLHLSSPLEISHPRDSSHAPGLSAVSHPYAPGFSALENILPAGILFNPAKSLWAVEAGCKY